MAPMLSDSEVEARLAAVAPDLPQRVLLCRLLLAFAEERLPPAEVDRLRALVPIEGKGDYDICPARDGYRLVFELARALAPKVGGVEQALRECARFAAGRFVQSALWSTVQSMVGTGSPRRLLAALPAAVQSVLGVGGVSYRDLGPGAGALHFAVEPIPPAFYAEGLTVAFAALGCPVQVTARPLALTEVLYELRWDESVGGGGKNRFVAS